jgi:hypothetical protein
MLKGASPKGGEEQKLQLAFAIYNLAQQFLRYAVDPVQILNHHHNRRETAPCVQQLLQKFACAQSDQDTIKPRQSAFRDFEAEQVQQKAEVSS